MTNHCEHGSITSDAVDVCKVCVICVVRPQQRHAQARAADADLKCARLKFLIHIGTEVLFQAIAEKPARDQHLGCQKTQMPDLMRLLAAEQQCKTTSVHRVMKLSKDNRQVTSNCRQSCSHTA